MTWRKREIEEAQMQDDEFNRIEREAKARMMAVQYAMQKQPSAIPLITAEEWEALNKDSNEAK
jgi:hypothetical protein